MNPFVYQNPCCGDSFCFRSEELEQLNRLVAAGSNILLYSKRKFGKTSLIKELFNNKIDRSSHIAIHVDLFGITSYTDFIKLLYTQIAHSLPFDYRDILKKLKHFFLRANFTATMDDDGELTFVPSLTSYNFETLISDIYAGLERLSLETERKIVIALDEFQNITLIRDVEIDTVLKQQMERYPDINYIFTGLKRHLLTDLFSKKRSPLYDKVTYVELKPIPMEAFYAFVNSHFDGRMPRELFEHIYTMTEGESRLIQEFCYHLYHQESIETISREDIDQVCGLLLESKSDYFKMVMDRLTLPLKVALKAVIISDGKELYTKEHLFDLQTTKSSLNTAVRHLYKDEIIDKDGGRYYVTNKCFELWCKKKFL